MSRSSWIALLVACTGAGCTSVPEDWSVQAGSCVSTKQIPFSGLGADVEISPSGRYVAAGNNFIDLDAPVDEKGDGRVTKLRHQERAVFSSDNVLITTSGPTFIRYRWEGGWIDRERFTTGDATPLAGLLSRVGPYDVQRRGGTTRLVGFSAPSGETDHYRLVGGEFGGGAAAARSEIAFAGGREVLASDDFVIVEADLLPEEMEQVRRDHIVLQERRSSVCVSGTISCDEEAPAVRALIALAPDLTPLEVPTAAMSAFLRSGLIGIHAVNNRGDILASRPKLADEAAFLVLIAADGTTTRLFSFATLGADLRQHAALSDSGRVVMLFSAGHSGEKRLVVADIDPACGGGR